MTPDGPAPEHVVVQETINGSDFRVLLLDGKVVDVVRRVPAFVVGDGVRSTSELVDCSNRARSVCRMPSIEKDLKMGPFNDVPAKGVRRAVQRKANVSLGGVAFQVSAAPLEYKIVRRYCYTPH